MSELVKSQLQCTFLCATLVMNKTVEINGHRSCPASIFAHPLEIGFLVLDAPDNEISNQVNSSARQIKDSVQDQCFSLLVRLRRLG